MMTVNKRAHSCEEKLANRNMQVSKEIIFNAFNNRWGKILKSVEGKITQTVSAGDTSVCCFLKIKGFGKSIQGTAITATSSSTTC